MTCHRRPLLLVCALFAIACAPPRDVAIDSAFAYERAGTHVRELSTTADSGFALVELTYDSPLGGTVPATMIVPAGRGPFPIILYGHWMMEGSPTRNRGEFLDEARVMARAGALAFLIDGPLVRPGAPTSNGPVGELVLNSDATRHEVVDFRRALDILTARSDVDSTRIAYVGHSFGGRVGGVLAAIDKRLRYAVLMAGDFADQEYIFDSTNAAMRDFRRIAGDQRIRDFYAQNPWADPANLVTRTARAEILLQYGTRDPGIPARFAERYRDLFSGPRELRMYDAGHELNAAARQDRLEWLAKRLHVSSSAPRTRVPT